MITKTLSTTISGGVYPATFTWSSDCDGFITYSNKTGIINTDGILTTDITYDENDCLQCIFYIEINNGLSCFGIQDTKGIKALTCGDLNMFTSDNTASVNIVELGLNCSSSSGSSCTIPNIPFGTYTIEVNVSCSPLISNVSVNGVTQNGNGLFTFTTTTDFTTPYIQVDINCS